MSTINGFAAYTGNGEKILRILNKDLKKGKISIIFVI